MAKRITEFTEATTLADEDLLVAVDVGSAETKRITVENARAVLGGGGGGGGATETPIRILTTDDYPYTLQESDGGHALICIGDDPVPEIVVPFETLPQGWSVLAFAVADQLTITAGASMTVAIEGQNSVASVKTRAENSMASILVLDADGQFAVAFGSIDLESAT